MRTYAWRDPSDVYDGPAVQTVHRSPRSADDVEKLAAFIERNELGSRNRVIRLGDVRPHT